jgi:RNA polymerase sigma factor for flagellar operon FliA
VRERDELVVDHLGLVASRTRVFLTRWPMAWREWSFEDILQLGLEGLIDAAQRFDRSREIKFSTYAVHRIDGAIWDGCRGNRWFTGQKRDAQTRPEASLDEPVISRGNGTQAAYLLQDVIPGGIEPEQELSLEMDVEVLHQAFDRADLSTRELYILERYYWDEALLGDIGDELGISESRACQIRGRAVVKLREAVAL